MGAAVGKISSETPAHTIVQRADEYEIWRYPASVSAVVHAADLVTNSEPAPTGRAFSNAAFGILARYIGVFSKPENTASSSSSPEKVAMTAPVVQTPSAEKIAMTAPVVQGSGTNARGESMCFLLPAKYRSVEEAPIPTNPVVKLEMVEGGRVEAVLAFSGNFDMTVGARHANELLGYLTKDGVKPTGDWTAQGYNPPFTLPHLKRNEIHIPLDPAAYPVQANEEVRA